MRAIPVFDESQVADARRQTVALGESVGLDETESGRLAIVATELATNLRRHGGGGELLIGAVDDALGPGVECLALDKGPGIPDVTAAMRDGHSTAGSRGEGLGAVRRQSHLMEIYSRPGLGTAVLARVHRGDPRRVRAGAATGLGAVSLPMPGEEACGDGWALRRSDDAFELMVVDGLGHGPLAATAAHAAIRAFESAGELGPTALIDRMHRALLATRGAAVSVALIPLAAPNVTFVGVGNVTGTLISGNEARRMVGYNGTLGHSFKTAKPFIYPAAADALIVMATDGLATGWSLEAYPGLSQRHPQLIAGVLYRDFSRGRDDVTVVVARREAA